ncbi:MAG: aminotransferase class I/II-fold pyridoxal phosphate-dependent enzyme [Oscillospiraceae bacterium]|nr:aminotransferase class I/II-fold pyridoxal phosphate-dependent enzyme [Oscillospiraceae bacterium]
MSKTLQTMPGYGIPLVLDKAVNVSECIRLEAGEPNYVTPKYICDAAARAMEEGYTKYTPLLGYASVREAIARDNSEKVGRRIDLSEVIVTTGATMALHNALRAVAEEGDEVLLPDPCWPAYKMQLHSLGLKAVPYLMDEKNGMMPTREGIESLITPKTSVIIVNSPSNPTGAVFDEATIRMMIDLAVQYDLYVISDEIYDFLTYDGVKALSFKRFDPDGRVIMIGGASKKYAMPGWRIGFAIAQPEIVQLMGRVMTTYGMNTCCIAQKAYEAAITGPQDFVRESVESYRDRRDTTLAICREANVPVFSPQGAFYLWIDISASGMSADRFAEVLFERHLVGVAPGPAFGASGEGKIRVSIATEKEALCRGVRWICELVNENR